jgi:hypothetical protein
LRQGWEGVAVSSKQEANKASLAAVRQTLLREIDRHRSPVAKARARRSDGLGHGSVGATMVDLVVHEQGATLAALAEATKAKDPLPLLRGACRRAGLVLRFQRSGLPGVPGRYFAS